jgi:hypothetical protein
VHPLPVVQNDAVVQTVLGACAEQKVDQIVDVVRGCGRWPGKLAGVGVAAVLRVEVEYIGVDGLILIACLEGVPASNLRVVRFRVDRGRVLELRIRSLPSQMVKPLID